MNTATTEDSNIMKLSLTELLTKQYTSTVTFLFDHESPSSTAMQTNNERRVSNDIKNLNCTKLSLQIVKALLSSTNTTDVETANDATNNDRDNNQQLSTNDFQINIKLNENNLILLDVSYNPATAIGEGVAIQLHSIQSVGHLLHAIFTSNDTSNKQSLLSQKSSVVSEESDIVVENSNKGGKDLRIAKVRRSQTATLFSTLGKFKQLRLDLRYVPFF